jgi:hypothetical protein
LRIHYGFFCVLVGGCFADPGPAGGDDDDAAMTEGTGSPSTDSASSTSVGSVSGSGTSMSGTTVEPTSATATATTDSATTDATSDVETGIPSCGALGEACCGGTDCDEGACWHDQCVVFAGAYADPNTCDGGVCTENPSGNMEEIPPSTIPYLGMCGCPEGFRASSPLPTTSDYCPQEALLHTETDVFFCEHENVYANTTWQGAYATSQDPACEMDGSDDECIRPNLYTGACTCPPGSVEMVAETWAKCGGKGTADNAVTLHVCLNEGAEPTNFGGAYQVRWLNQGGTMCESGNPIVGGDCQCPAGFVGEALRITSPVVDNGGDLFVCVR